MSIYFDATQLPAPRGEYVAWIDGMGTGSAISNSLSIAANFIFKLHSAFSSAFDADSGMRAYPLMDGMYITSPNSKQLKNFLRTSFERLAEEFLSRSKNHHRFLVRGAIAFGATLHGSEVPTSAFRRELEPEIPNLEEIKSRTLLSSVMAAAYKAESSAPPFGVYVHDSALSVPQLVDKDDDGFPTRLWRWWGKGNQTHKQLGQEVMAYFDEAEHRTLEWLYPIDRIKAHRQAAEEYFEVWRAK